MNIIFTVLLLIWPISLPVLAVLCLATRQAENNKAKRKANAEAIYEQ